MKHRHYDMIVAKAANTNLAVLLSPRGNVWAEYECGGFPAFSNGEYFLCLPQHKEACLHWLNGGEVLILDFPDDEIEIALTSGGFSGWHGETVFMSEVAKIRIKPKKEKRWIGIYNHNVTSQHFDSIDTAKLFIKRRDDFKNCPPDVWQFIEIEVEVK